MRVFGGERGGVTKKKGNYPPPPNIVVPYPVDEEGVSMDLEDGNDGVMMVMTEVGRRRRLMSTSG